MVAATGRSEADLIRNHAATITAASAERDGRRTQLIKCLDLARLYRLALEQAPACSPTSKKVTISPPGNPRQLA
jgi:hypothetical protein